MVKYLNRREGGAYIKEQTGISIAISTLEKDATLGRGPVPAAQNGLEYLYLPEEMVRYAYSRIKTEITPRRAGPGRKRSAA